jgi:hypothetical protein
MERGQFYRQHFGLDDFYHGGRIGADFGGGGWSGQKLGWTKYNPAERIWYGMPDATKTVVVGGPTALQTLAEFGAEQPDPGQMPEAESRRRPKAVRK